MLNYVNKFIKDENGAVTVDWVVLCAGVVALAVAIVTAMQTGTLDLSDGIATKLSNWTF